MVIGGILIHIYYMNGVAFPDFTAQFAFGLMSVVAVSVMLLFMFPKP